MARSDVELIPEATRWQVCARLLAKLPLLYDITCRRAVGDDYDVLEHAIWIEMAHEAKDLADAFRLPRSTAGELASTLSILATALFGRDFRFEPLGETGERASLRVARCPFSEEADLLEIDHSLLPDRCLAFTIPLIEALNPAYSLRYVRAACAGDRGCELKIMSKEEAKAED
ncbi:MAG: hypothetical protein ABFC89_06850 [Methanospirillum sp.]